MRKLLTLLMLLLVATSSFGQAYTDTGEIKVGYTKKKNMYFSDGKVISQEDMVASLRTNTEAIAMYNKAMARKKWGYGIMAGGYGTAVVMLGFIMAPGRERVYTYEILGVIAGLGVGTVGLALVSTTNKRVGQAVDKYNEGVRAANTGAELSFGLTSSGPGFVLKF